jgi:predicted transcriptional regulator
MKSAKDEVLEILEQVPDDASLEEIQYRIYVRQRIDRGLKDLDEGRAISHQEMEARMSRRLGE